jgi:hypothetical protein
MCTKDHQYLITMLEAKHWFMIWDYIREPIHNYGNTCSDRICNIDKGVHVPHSGSIRGTLGLFVQPLTETYPNAMAIQDSLPYEVINLKTIHPSVEACIIPFDGPYSM